MDTMAKGPGDLLTKAVESLRTGVLEDAHALLVRLIRKHRTDADVIFNLALARKRLGYDVSAEALFKQAFEHGYTPPRDNPPAPHPELSKHFIWTDSTNTVQLLLKERARRTPFFVETLVVDLQALDQALEDNDEDIVIDEAAE